MEVGNRIREQREAKGISQDELAQKVFVSRQTVSNWERGKTLPDVQSLLLLSNLFDVSVDTLVRGDEETMAKEIENYELERYKIKVSVGLSVALIVLGAVMLSIMVAQGIGLESPLYKLALGIVVVGGATSFVAERIENRYDIETMREVQAFLHGAEPEQIERERRMPKALRAVVQMAAGAAVAALLMVGLSTLMALFVG